MDFGGTAVWVYLQAGSKTFVFWPASARNSRLFRDHDLKAGTSNWTDMEGIMGELDGPPEMFTLKPGQLVMIPGSTIHAVVSAHLYAR